MPSSTGPFEAGERDNQALAHDAASSAGDQDTVTIGDHHWAPSGATPIGYELARAFTGRPPLPHSPHDA
jgi:hypothetical protein